MGRLGASKSSGSEFVYDFDNFDCFDNVDEVDYHYDGNCDESGADAECLEIQCYQV